MPKTERLKRYTHGDNKPYEKESPTLFTPRKLRSAFSTWATSEGIVHTLKKEYKDTVHIIDPEQGSIFSPFSKDAKTAEIAAVIFAKSIVGFTQDNVKRDNGIISDGKPLTKPIIAIMNTDSAKPRYSADTKIEGGVHWVAFVILPKNYQTSDGIELKNTHEKIFLIDSLNPNRKPPAALKQILTQGFTEEIIAPKSGADDTPLVRKQVIAPAFPDAVWEELPGFKVQQAGHNDCGWRAMGNAAEIIAKGTASGIIAETQQQKRPQLAEALRERYPDLDKTVFPDLKLSH